jgi:hypothetical protein
MIGHHRALCAASAVSLLFSIAMVATPARAATFSFSGNLSIDDEIQLFNFTVGTASTVVLKTLSYAGGTNAAGTTFSAGGFDPILALYNAVGTQIDTNDDGTSSEVSADPLTGRFYDTFLTADLAAGSYTVAVTQFNNFGGLTLAELFGRQGQGNFTVAFGCTQGFFCDVSGASRNSQWAFDILGVDGATNPTGGGGGTTGDVPLPAAAWLLGAGLAAFGIAGRRRKRRAR